MLAGPRKDPSYICHAQASLVYAFSSTDKDYTLYNFARKHLASFAMILISLSNLTGTNYELNQ